MNTKIRTVLTAASLLALSAVTSHAQLIINNIYSTFSATGSGVASGNNGSANVPVSVQYGTSLTLTTFPFPNNSTLPPTTNPPPLLAPDGIAVRADAWFIDRNLNGATFTDGLNFALGLDFAGSPSSAADLVLNFTTSFAPSIGGAAEHYSIAPISSLTGEIVVAGARYSYIVFPSGLDGNLAASGPASNALAAIDIQFTLIPVPEPSTYALFGVVALMGVVAVRRFRSSKSVAA